MAPTIFKQPIRVNLRIALATIQAREEEEEKHRLSVERKKKKDNRYSKRYYAKNKDYIAAKRRAKILAEMVH